MEQFYVCGMCKERFDTHQAPPQSMGIVGVLCPSCYSIWLERTREAQRNRKGMKPPPEHAKGSRKRYVSISPLKNIAYKTCQLCGKDIPAEAGDPDYRGALCKGCSSRLGWIKDKEMQTGLIFPKVQKWHLKWESSIKAQEEEKQQRQKEVQQNTKLLEAIAQRLVALQEEYAQVKAALTI